MRSVSLKYENETNFRFVIEDLSLAVLGLGKVLPLEVGVVEVFRHVDSADVDLGAGGNDVGLVHAPQWHTVHLVWSCKVI